MTVDLRNMDAEKLRLAERRLYRFVERLSRREDIYMARRSLADNPPVGFHSAIVERVEKHARALGYSVKRLPSGAGHDAQAFAPNCPTGMIFVPSARGISHNVEEFTSQADIEAGANVLLHTALEIAAVDTWPGP